MKKFHPLADMFPLLQGEEFAALVEDIRAKGQREDIVLHPDGSVLDGRNRLMACQAAGVEPRFRTYDGDDALGFVISVNIKRRHLNPSQLGIIAARLATMPQGARTDLNLAPNGAMSNAEAAKLLHVGEGTVDRAKRVLRECEPEVIEAIERGERSVTNALAEKEDNPQWFEGAGEGDTGTNNWRSLSTGNEVWYTPPDDIARVREVYSGDIDLDPASNEIAQRTNRRGLNLLAPAALEREGPQSTPSRRFNCICRSSAHE
jgi:hypothetical protein